MVLLANFLRLLSIGRAVQLEYTSLGLPLKILVQNEIGNHFNLAIFHCHITGIQRVVLCLEILVAQDKFEVEFLRCKLIRILTLEIQQLQFDLQVRYLRLASSKHEF